MTSPAVVQSQAETPRAGQQPSIGLSPTLQTSPDLLLNLGLCIIVSSSREVSRVRLPHSAPAGPGLSTNLIQIVNEGSNAFLGAYKDLLSISTASEELSRENGRLDQLALLIVNGATKSSTDMVYRWVMDCVAVCERSGADTEKNFDNWKATVEKVQKAVCDAKDINEVQLDMTERAKEFAANSIDVNETRISSAWEEVVVAIEKQDEQKQNHDRQTRAHESQVSDQLKEYMVNPFLGAVKRPFKWATGSAPVEDAARLRIEAQRELQNATRELSKQHQKHQELKLQSERLKAEIKDYEHKEKKLNTIGTTIGEVCVLLVALGDDVRKLLATFAVISKEIERTVMTRKDLEKPGGFTMGSMNINPFKKKGTLKQVNKKDKQLMNMVFLDRIRQMKQVCLGIHITANLYASVINDVINYGFSEAIRFSYDNLGESSPSKIIAERKKAMAKWHQEAGRICSAKNQEAKRILETRLQSMSQTPPPAYSFPAQPQ